MQNGCPKFKMAKKYESLAFNYQMSLGSVKNRLKVIFDEIGAGDRQEFFNKYSDYEICYGDEFFRYIS